MFNQSDLSKIDLIVNNFVSNDLQEPFLLNLMKVMSFFASSGFLIVISILMLIFMRNKYSVYLVYNLVAAVMLNTIFKLIIQRDRPTNMLVTEQGYSFPSGHAMVATIFYGIIIYFIYSSKLNRIYKIIYITILSILILLISFSRIYLSVHYLSDVYVGILIGVIYVSIFVGIKNKNIKQIV